MQHLEFTTNTISFEQVLIDAVASPIFYKDAAGVYIGGNKAFQQYLGLSPERFIGKTVYEIAPLDLAEQYDKADKELLNNPGVQTYEASVVYADGTRHDVVFNKSTFTDAEGKVAGLIGVIQDITEHKQTERMYREVGERLQLKLSNILSPDYMVAEEELRNIINSEFIQSVMNDFYTLTKIGVAIIDLKGNILVATGWQDICTRFHRVNPETATKCKESDITLSQGVPPGEIKGYKCQNNLWDFVTPIIIGDKHMGNLFLGQFFFEDEVLDYDLFDQQADRYGFNKAEYRAALDRVPRWTRERVNTVLRFYRLLTDMISGLSYSNLQLEVALHKNKQAREALQKANYELEQRVEDRTKDLIRLNEELQKDITERTLAEETLRQSEEKYRRLVGAVPGILYTYSDKQAGIYYSAQVESVLGYTAEFLREHPTLWHDSIHPDDLPKVDQQIQGGVKKNGIEAEYRILDAQGQWRWLLDRSVRVISSEHDETIIEGLAVDITERKRAEQLLLQERALYLDIVNNQTAGIYRIRAFPKEQWQADAWLSSERSPYSVELANDRFCEILGINRQAYEANPGIVIDLVHPEDKTEFARKNEEANTGMIPFQWEGRLLIGGRICWVHFESLPRIVESGDILWTGILYDITERKLAEEMLQESKALLSNAFNSSPLLKTISDLATGKYIEVNDSFCRVSEFSREEAIGKTSIELGWLSAEDRVKLAKELEQGTAIGLELALHSKTGKIINCRYSGNVIKTAKGNILFSTAENITEQKQSEDERRSLQERLLRAEKMESLGTLAGGVAHDLNNVLGIIVGYSEMILDQVDKSSPLRRGLENVMNGGLKAAAIVEDLLTLARRGVQSRNILNLNKIIVDCQQSPEFMKLSDNHSTVKIVMGMEADLLNISGSSIHLGKTLYNLVSNACEAMPKGGIVTIKTVNRYLDKPVQGYDQIKAGDYIVLTVSDTGEGIPEANLKRIFEPFYTKKVMGRSGTGLGLAVVWGTMQDHNGYINVQSEESKGSTFTLYFPVSREDITVEATAVGATEYMGRGESILIVDDVKEQRDLASSLLGSLHYNVSSVPSGEDAVAYLKEHEVDLMVLDMIMDPGMDGLDTFEQLIKIRPTQKAIIVSGFSESERVKAARNLGAGAYVRKPYIKEKLGLAVRQELDRVV